MTCVWACFISHIFIVYTEAVQHYVHLEHNPPHSSWKCNSTSQYARSIQTATAWLTIEYDYFISFFFFFAADCCFDPSLILCYARVWIQLHSYFLSSLDGLQVGFLSKQSRNARVILRETNKSSIAASPSVSLLHTAYTRFSWVFYLV